MTNKITFTDLQQKCAERHELWTLIHQQHEAIQIMKPYYDKAMKEQNNVL